MSEAVEVTKTLLYIAMVEYDDAANGVGRKVHGQIEGMEALGFEVSCVAYGTDGVYVYSRTDKKLLCAYGKKPKRYTLLASLRKYLKENSYDVCYIRFPYIDYQLKKIIKQLKKAGIRIYMEIATYPILPLRYKIHGLGSATLYWQHKLFCRDLHKYLEKVLYMGNHADTIWGCKASLIPNGCNPNQYPMKKIKEPNGKIELLAVAAMYGMHGYDRILRGMAEYYKEKQGDVEIHFKLVGEGPKIPDYKKICKEEGIEEYVEFYGAKSGEELDKIFDESDIGISSLAWYTKKMYQCTTLKAKEYLGRGIPFVYACEEIGMPSTLPYVLEVENKPGNVDMRDIVSFYNEMCKTDYREEMRAFVNEHFQWKIIYQEHLKYE